MDRGTVFRHRFRRTLTVTGGASRRNKGCMKIEIISATRRSRDDFWAKSALGASLRRLSHDRELVTRIAVSNTRGLPLVYNESLATADPAGILVFIHDDVWIDDYFLRQRLIEGLERFDVLGVAGNRRRLPGQPVWACADTGFTLDDPANLSGTVAHGPHPFGALRYFGEVPAECELLDGVFLAARTAALRDKGVAFDPRFDFHFYDLDFCRSARQRGLKLGTWPICLTHQSGGGFGGEPWKKGYQIYCEKWGG
jgi:hypothetical protein